jgi:hypothetical protein
MNEEIQKDPLDDEIINFSFTVAQVNGLLNILGNAPLPYSATAPIINLINMQGEQQFRAAVAKFNEKEKDESETAT